MTTWREEPFTWYVVPLAGGEGIVCIQPLSGAVGSSEGSSAGALWCRLAHRATSIYRSRVRSCRRVQSGAQPCRVFASRCLVNVQPADEESAALPVQPMRARRAVRTSMNTITLGSSTSVALVRRGVTSAGVGRMDVRVRYGCGGKYYDGDTVLDTVEGGQVAVQKRFVRHAATAVAYLGDKAWNMAQRSDRHRYTGVLDYTGGRTRLLGAHTQTSSGERRATRTTNSQAGNRVYTTDTESRRSDKKESYQ
jgi:hypothetical protein